MSFAGLLNQTCDVYRATISKATSGGAERTWAVQINDMPCRLQALRGTERAVRGSTGVEATHKLWCIPPAGETITEKDEIQIGSTRYRIAFVDDFQGLGHHLTFDLLELRDGGG